MRARTAHAAGAKQRAGTAHGHERGTLVSGATLSTAGRGAVGRDECFSGEHPVGLFADRTRLELILQRTLRIWNACHEFHIRIPNSRFLIPNSDTRYVLKIVVTGSTRVAARAGAQLAAIATAASASAAIAKTAGSVGLTPKSSDLSVRVTANAPTRPSATPPPARRTPSPTISRRTASAGAPSASRIPISRLRRATE